MRRRVAVLLLLILAMPAAASARTVCQAQLQCRGDAQAMCAPSALQIVVQPRGQSAQLWIDRQGPYPARADGAGTWRLLHFGGSHRLELQSNGGFRYLGNRGKRFTGTCEEQG